jgi:EAL domain-containing protein (putative c-di-GMP-specific phosphodiesterase class I)
MYAGSDGLTGTDGDNALAGAIGELALVDQSIACFPIRATADASLQGIEVRSCAEQMFARAPARGLAQSARKDCPPLSALQLERVLDKSMARTMVAHGTRLWIPLPLQTLLDKALGMRLRRAIHGGEWGPSLLTLAIPPDEAVSDPQAMARALAALALCDAAIAFTDVSLLTPRIWLESIRAGCIDELRFNGQCLRRAAADSLAATVSSIHQIGISVAGLDVTTPEQCEIAIQSGLDSIQGSLVGQALHMCQLETQLLPERVACTRASAAMEAAPRLAVR